MKDIAPKGVGHPMPKHIGAALNGLFPSSGAQNKQKKLNPIPSHRLPRMKPTMQADMPRPATPPASWQ